MKKLHGGERKNAGRHKDPFTCKYVTLYIPDEIIPTIKKQIADWKEAKRNL